MTYWYPRAARLAWLHLLGAVALVSAGCGATDRLTEPSAPPATKAAPSFASSFRGGIPFGISSQPTSEFGEVLSGSFRNIWPKGLRAELAEIKSRGGKVVLTLAGHEEHFRDRRGYFDFAKWKARVDRYKAVDFSDYVRDGTIIGHYLIDEPYDPFNWGEPVPGSMIEQMAKYSKQLWPNLVTIVRAQPDEIKWNGTYRYLDAAWAQYTYRRGDVQQYIRKHVAEAQAMALGLVVGLNITKGGPKKGPLTSDEIESWGSTLLSSSYPCAFISWEYRKAHVESPDVRRALESLSAKARNRATRSCRADGELPAGANDPEPPIEPEPPVDSTSTPPTDSTSTLPDSVPEEPDSTTPDSLPETSAIQLLVAGWTDRAGYHMRLTWAGASGPNVDLYKNGAFVRTMPNDGQGLSVVGRPGTYSYRVCEAGTSRCSNTASATTAGVPTVATIVLKLVRRTERGYPAIGLTWSGAAGAMVDLYKNGNFVRTMPNDGRGLSIITRRGTYSYRICEAGKSRCSNTASASI